MPPYEDYKRVNILKLCYDRRSNIKSLDYEIEQYILELEHKQEKGYDGGTIMYSHSQSQLPLPIPPYTNTKREQIGD
jgi:hypothetical protein